MRRSQDLVSPIYQKTRCVLASSLGYIMFNSRAKVRGDAHRRGPREIMRIEYSVKHQKYNIIY
jgi:hypothetical protein